VILLWAIVRTFGFERGYPLVQVMAYTPYVVVLALVVCGVVAALREWPATGVGAVAAIALVVAVLPRAHGGPDEAPPGTEVRMLSLNTWRGNANVTELLEFIEDRDVNLLVLQELPINGAKRLQRRGLGDHLPYGVLGIEDKGGGGIYSSLPLDRIEPEHTGPRQPRALVEPEGATPFEVMSVHPRAPQSPESTRLWAREMKKLPRAGEPGPPKVLAGDFNATLDHAELRDLIDSGYRDAAYELGSGLAPTWPVGLKWPPPVTIDHVLVEEPIAITGFEVVTIDRSDHRATYTELVAPEN